LTLAARRWLPAIEAVGLLLIALPTALWLRTSAVWLLLPAAYLALAKRDLEGYGLTLRGVPGWRFHAALLAFVFGPYVAGHYLYGTWLLGMQFAWSLPENFFALALDHLLGVGLAEEFFFRAYMQTQFDRVWAPRWSLLGTRVGPGFILANTLFAACHVFHGGPVRLVVFLPGLLYGWLWARTGSVFVPAFYHGFSNILMAVMLASLSGP